MNPQDPEVFPAILCGQHRFDGWLNWVPRNVISAGCVLTEEEGDPVEIWEPDTGRTIRESVTVVRHWHTDWTQDAHGAYRFYLQPEDATP